MKRFLAALFALTLSTSLHAEEGMHVGVANASSDTPVTSAAGPLGQLWLMNYGKLMWSNGQIRRGVGLLDPAEFGHPFLMTPSDGADWSFVVNGSTTLSPTPADNTIRVRNDAQDHYSAIAFNCAKLDGGWEVGAIGYGNSLSAPVFRRSLYFESYGGASDIRFVMHAPQGVVARFAKITGDFVVHAPGTPEADGPEKLRIVRATGAITTAGDVNAPNIAALTARIAALEARLDSFLGRLQEAAAE